MLNVSNALTTVRLLLVMPVVITYLMSFPYHGIIASVLFAIASLIDWADGYIARKRNEESSLGAAFDHISDKILIASILIAITYQTHSLIIAICTMIIIARELFISGLREHMSHLGQRGIVTVSWFGKMKTALQMVVILFVLVSQPLNMPLLFGEAMIIFVALVTLVSAWSYLPDTKSLKDSMKKY